MNTQALASLSKEELIAKLMANQAANQRKVTLKVTASKVDEKTGERKGTDGAISMYGLGRFPITLYRSQWERLIETVKAGHVDAFILANAELLATKE